MKRILALLTLILIPHLAYAGTITVNTISVDATAAGINDNFTTIVNEINGEIEGSAAGAIKNIKADTLGELDMGDNINPRIRTNELLGIGEDTITTQNAFVASGLVCSDGDVLQVDVTAGSGYMNGYRITLASNSEITISDNVATYVWLDENGNLVENSSASDNSIILCSVTSSGGDITVAPADVSNRSVPNLVTPTNYREGLKLSRKVGDTTVVSVDAGFVEINGAMVSKTTTTEIDVSSGSYADGGQGSTTQMQFVGIDSAGNIKWVEIAPTHSNHALSIPSGQLKWVSDGGTTWRILGWVYNSADTVADYQLGNIRENGLPNAVVRKETFNHTITATGYASTELKNTDFNFYSSGGMVTYRTAITGDPGAAIELDAIVDVDGTDIAESESELTGAGSGNEETLIVMDSKQYSAGSRLFKTEAIVGSGTFTVDHTQSAIWEH